MKKRSKKLKAKEKAKAKTTAKPKAKRQSATKKGRAEGGRISSYQSAPALWEQTVVDPECGYPDGNGVSIESAKAKWLLGDWKALADIDPHQASSSPERAVLALLVASAHQQLGDSEQARSFTHLATEWGCDKRLVAQLLIAGVYNSLGRAAALKRDQRRIESHFRDAVSVGAPGRDAELLSQTRTIREVTRIGLLPQAADLLGKEIKAVKESRDRPSKVDARVRILETELELLHHELSLAQRRQQLFGGPPHGRTPTPDLGSDGWMEGLKNRSFSQLGQDLWVLEQTSYKRGGFFVEFGATDGVLLSNTWLLENEFGWNGICAEPNPKFFAQLKANRTCIISDACIGARSGEEIEFVLADVYGGMKKHVALDNNANRRSGYLTDEENTLSVKTISLNDFLVKKNAPRKIDYLSVDTEGSEFEILESFPWNEWQIDLLTVEHNNTPQRELLRNLMKSMGYSRIDAQWDDWYFRKS